MTPEGLGPPLEQRSLTQETRPSPTARPQREETYQSGGSLYHGRFS